ncbi:MAG: hypothetical protein ABIJ57_15835 [Pseudomonadota bacterium]
MCRLVQQDRGGIKCKGLEDAGGECPEGKIPTLHPDNYEIWGLFQEMTWGLLRTDGYDYGAIQVVFDIHGIPQARRPEMLNQIVRLIGVVDAERKARADKK